MRDAFPVEIVNVMQKNQNDHKKGIGINANVEPTQA